MASKNPELYNQVLKTHKFIIKIGCPISYHESSSRPKTYLTVNSVTQDRYRNSDNADLEFSHCKTSQSILSIEGENIYDYFIHGGLYMASFSYK